MTASRVLEEARALVEQGWCRHGDEEPEEGGGVRYSIVGAVRLAGLRHARADHSDRENAEFWLEEGLPGRRHAGTHEGARRRLEAWNDAEGRTHEEVVELFDQALAKARGDERIAV